MDSFPSKRKLVKATINSTQVPTQTFYINKYRKIKFFPYIVCVCARQHQAHDVESQTLNGDTKRQFFFS